MGETEVDLKMSIKIKKEEGASAIEFALVLPLLLVLVFGIIEFSILFYDKAMLTNASREGARVGIVYRYQDAQKQELHILVFWDLACDFDHPCFLGEFLLLLAKFSLGDQVSRF